MFRKISLFLGILTLTGCALFQGATNVEQLIVQEGTAIAIQSGCSSSTACYDKNAAHVLVIAKQLQTVAVGSLLTDLQTVVNNELGKLNLSPAELAPLLSLESQIMQFLSSKVSSSSVLTASTIAIIQTVAGWIVQEASIYAPAAVATFKAHT
jgi:hypothetical protein